MIIKFLWKCLHRICFRFNLFFFLCPFSMKMSSFFAFSFPIGGRRGTSYNSSSLRSTPKPAFDSEVLARLFETVDCVYKWLSQFGSRTHFGPASITRQVVWRPKVLPPWVVLYYWRVVLKSLKSLHPLLRMFARLKSIPLKHVQIDIRTHHLSLTPS